MKTYLGLMFPTLITLAAWAGPAVLIEDGGTPIAPISQRSRFQEERDTTQGFDGVEELRTKKRVGLGVQAAGTTGLLGVLIELNLKPHQSVLIGLGGAPEFSAFNFQWKYVFGGENISPYAGIGYARWASAGSKADISKATPKILSSKFLSEEERKTGKFAVDLLTPSIGLQYHNLLGPAVGTSYFAEVVFLTPLNEVSPAPMGAIGATYYF